jgi:general stress protein 26
MNTQELLGLLARDRWVAFATVDDGQPRVRMMTVLYHRGKLWCFTSASSAKANQLRHNDKFEFVAHMAEEGRVSSLRATGQAEIVDDSVVKKELSTSFPVFKDHWQSFDDPDFMLLRLNIESIEVERGPDTKAEKFTLVRT